ncbi:hypothetical protein Sango_1676300 [Sesamum angolense]|uniref:LETM1-like protein n=1 Tax=Sesamum angolense TaxID=2727404 RepID=A0AAE1WKZ1_9LAMI|nr:hypothetical protein Sango_1676300 [Sesamum angolense]
MFFCHRKAALSEDRLNFKTNSPAKIVVREQERRRLAKNALTKQLLLIHGSASQVSPSKWVPPGALSSTATNADSGESISDNEYSLGKSQSNEMEFNRVNRLVRVLHETARSFSVAIETLDLARTGPAVAMAWNGVDVHAWHKHIAYQVAAYALLKAAIEVELFLSHNRCNNPSPVHKILSPNTDFLRDYIESQLASRNPKLVQWFQIVELPRVAEVFMPLFKKWSVEYAGSGVAGTIMAITCCAAVGKLGSGRISCSFFSDSIEDAMIELMNMAHDQVTVDKLHHLATEAGFEEDFLSHFGSKVLPSKTIEDIEFWIGLVQEKLSAAFQRESVIKARDDLSDKELMFLQLLRVWYPLHISGIFNPVRVSTLNGGFAHYSNSTHQTLDPDLLEFLLQSDLPKIGERNGPNSTSPFLIKGTAQQRPDELRSREKHRQASLETQDVGIGTQVLFVDISDTLRFMVKKLCGDKVTKRETRKMRRTLSDIATLIPITILMLLPIPSPYSEERLNLAKQLKRTKKMEVQRIHVEDATSNSFNQTPY